MLLKKLFATDKEKQKNTEELYDAKSREYIEIDEYGATIHDKPIPSISKYDIDIDNLTCTCADWKKSRMKFHKTDPRRLCKHIIRKFDYMVIDERYTNGECIVLPKHLMPFGYTITKCREDRRGFYFYDEIRFYENFIIARNYNSVYIDTWVNKNHHPICNYWYNPSFLQHKKQWYGGGGSWQIGSNPDYLMSYVISELYDIPPLDLGIPELIVKKREIHSAEMVDLNSIFDLYEIKNKLNNNEFLSLLESIGFVRFDSDGYCQIFDEILEYCFRKKEHKRKIFFYIYKFPKLLKKIKNEITKISNSSQSFMSTEVIAEIFKLPKSLDIDFSQREYNENYIEEESHENIREYFRDPVSFFNSIDGYDIEENLLKVYNSKLTPRKFHIRMKKLGLMDNPIREWVLTEKGLRYGYNVLTTITYNNKCNNYIINSYDKNTKSFTVYDKIKLTEYGDSLYPAGRAVFNEFKFLEVLDLVE